MARSNVPQQTIDRALGAVTPSTGTAALLAALGGALPEGTTDLNTSLSEVSKQLDGLITATQAQSEVTAANTLAIAQSTAAHSGGGAGSAAGTIGRVASRFLGGGLGLAPLISGLIGMFGGGGSDPAPQLARYFAPPSLHFAAANGTLEGSVGGLRGISYDQSGLPRASAGGGANTPSITVQVQAIDSRSFLDHSDAIASAVRQAMLNMHSLNDVVSDL